MFNVVINNEQYDEYLAQKNKIKELEARNNFLKEQYDQLNEKLLDAIKKCDTLEKQVDYRKMQFESTYEHYQQALSEKAALIKERDRFTERNKFLEKEHAEISELNLKQGKTIINQDKMIETLQAKIADYDNMDRRFKELIDEISNLREQIGKARNELESIKNKTKEPVCDDLEEAYSPDNNTVIKIKNLYVTNNHFTEEDKDD